MKDILRNGAITVEFEANKLFSMYKEGILTEKGMKGVKDAVMPTNLGSDLPPKQSLSDIADIVGMSEKEQDSQLVEEDDQLLQIGESKPKKTKTVSSSDSKKSQPALSDKTMEDMGKSFHNQSHTVLLIGWGYDESSDTKYWIVRNSYGPKWGNKGDFKVQRGQDDFGIESNLVSYEPVLCADSSTDSCVIS